MNNSNHLFAMQLLYLWLIVILCVLFFAVFFPCFNDSFVFCQILISIAFDRPFILGKINLELLFNISWQRTNLYKVQLSKTGFMASILLAKWKFVATLLNKMFMTELVEIKIVYIDHNCHKCWELQTGLLLKKLLIGRVKLNNTPVAFVCTKFCSCS